MLSNARQSLDSYYIRNWSRIWLDIYILARTVGAVLTGRGVTDGSPLRAPRRTPAAMNRPLARSGAPFAIFLAAGRSGPRRWRSTAVSFSLPVRPPPAPGWRSPSWRSS
ncbi:MAG: hypothetical protein R2862_06190 [Thermoanaerobaculia bacterium]